MSDELRDEAESSKFILLIDNVGGKGHFCPAVAKAVKTMKKEEKVLLTVKPQYGFGEKGKPASGDEGVVPPNATLQITLELVSWKTVSEVTDDKKIIKKILKEGEGYEKPNEGAVVKVKLIGKLQDGTVFVKKGHDDSEELFEFKTDEEQVIDGLGEVEFVRENLAVKYIEYDTSFEQLHLMRNTQGIQMRRKHGLSTGDTCCLL
ncbi:AP2/ERF domain-containing protein [Psidium guajava]|nr:AP2/ERF domain-containing protein [Psidium guajava]